MLVVFLRLKLRNLFQARIFHKTFPDVWHFRWNLIPHLIIFEVILFLFYFRSVLFSPIVKVVLLRFLFREMKTDSKSKPTFAVWPFVQQNIFSKDFCNLPLKLRVYRFTLGAIYKWRQSLIMTLKWRVGGGEQKWRQKKRTFKKKKAWSRDIFLGNILRTNFR